MAGVAREAMSTLTMRDIARSLDVSVATVSKVLRGHLDISGQTRERVLARVKELDYRPNLRARSLATGRSNLIGLIVPDLLHPFFAEAAKALSSVLKESGYYVIISSSEEQSTLEEREIEQYLAQRLDGLIIASCSPSPAKFQYLKEQRVPFVLIDRRFSGFRANYVGINDVAAGRMATAHLLSIGCKRVAHIRGPEVTTATQRFEGYRQALIAEGLPFNPDLVQTSTTTDVDAPRKGYAAMKQLLKKGRPDGVFCSSDPIAIGALDAILDSGFQIPKDIALVGCGNLHYDASLKVSLSSIDQQVRKIGIRAAKLLLQVIETKNFVNVSQSILQPSLIIRDSSSRK